MAKLTFTGYAYDTETRKVEFLEVVCTECNGTKEVERGISCPNYGRKVNHLPGRQCPHCGAKNRNSHKLVGWKTIRCPRCNDDGLQMMGETDFLDISPLVDYIEIFTLRGMHGSTFNESYYGIGIIGGCTDYGRYLEESGGDFQKIIEHVRRETKERNRSSQACQFLTKDGRLIEKAVLKMNVDGWHLYSVGSTSSVIPS